MEHFKGGNGLSGLMGGKLASPSPARARLGSSPGSALATPSFDLLGGEMIQGVQFISK